MHCEVMTKISPLSRSDETINHYDPNEVFVTPAMTRKLTNLGLALPNLENIRSYRRKRILAQMEQRKVDALLLFDPLNIRYATDSSNMQVWTTHNLARAALVTVDGHFILWDFTRCEHMTKHLHRLNEVRTVAGKPFSQPIWRLSPGRPLWNMPGLLSRLMKY